MRLSMSMWLHVGRMLIVWDFRIGTNVPQFDLSGGARQVQFLAGDYVLTANECVQLGILGGWVNSRCQRLLILWTSLSLLRLMFNHITEMVSQLPGIVVVSGGTSGTVGVIVRRHFMVKVNTWSHAYPP